MKSKLLMLVAAATFSTATIPAFAGTESVMMENYMFSLVEPWVTDKAIVDAIRAQNDAHAALTNDEILAMDTAWRAEADAGHGPTIDPVLTSAVSDLLRAKVAESEGVITEVFIMDNKGLNVATSGVTSDYWQGDEDKFTATFPKGPGTTLVGDLEMDDSTGKMQGQVSMTITDPVTGAAIGAVTAAFVADSLL
ncbi:MAG: hypothetical protein ABI459_05455 [Deltaproteobacteria bacterium]